MNWTELLNLIPNGDTLTTKFVKRVQDDAELGQIITAFANTMGGAVIIGLDRANLHLVGSTLSELQLNRLVERIFPTVFVRMAPIVKGNRIIHILTVEMGGDKPYVFQSTVYSLDESRPWSFKLKEEPAPEGITATLGHGAEYEKPSVDGAVTAVDSHVGHVNVPTGTSQLASDLSDPSSRLNHRQRDALQYVAKNGMIQNRLYRELFSVSHKTAHIELTEMVDVGLLVQGGSGRSTHYRGTISSLTGSP